MQKIEFDKNTKKLIYIALGAYLLALCGFFIMHIISDKIGAIICYVSISIGAISCFAAFFKIKPNKGN